MADPTPRETGQRTPPARRPRRWPRLVFAVLCLVLTLAVALAVSLRQPLGPSEWQWRYHEEPDALDDGDERLDEDGLAALPAAVIIAVMLVLAVGAFRSGVRGRSEEVALVAVMTLLSVALQFMGGLLSRPLGLADSALVNARPWSGGYYLESLLIGGNEDKRPAWGRRHYTSVRTYLASYAEHISHISVKDPRQGHIADHPPGPALLHLYANRLAAAFPRAADALVWATEEESSVITSAIETSMLATRVSSVARVPVWSGGVWAFAFLPETRMAPMRITRAEYAGLWLSAHVYRLAAGLLVLPVYLLTRALYSSGAGVIAMLLTALIPSLHVFGPFLDQLFPLFAVVAFLMFHYAVERQSVGWAAACGAVMFVGLQFTLAFLAVVAMMGITVILRFVVGGEMPTTWPKIRRWLALAGAGAGGIVVPAILGRLWLSYDSFAVWRICLQKHARFSAVFERSYWTWTLYNPVDFVIFMGVPVALLVLYGVASLARRFGAWHREQKAGAEVSSSTPDEATSKPRLMELGRPAFDMLLGGFLLTMVLLNLMGKNLGEVGRLWMFLMPFGAVAAAGALSRMAGRWTWLVVGVCSLQALQMICLKLSVNAFYP